MSQREQFEVLVLGSGTAGKLIAWHMAGAGRRTAVVERRWVGGSCPNIACMPSKNEIWSAKAAHFVRHAAEFGMTTGPVVIDMAVVRERKRKMVEAQVAAHLRNYKASAAELIMGSARFVAPKTLEVNLNEGGTRLLAGTRCSSMSARTRQFRAFPDSLPPSRSRISRLSSSMTCRGI
jgi:pyruvate/2-oxoglutarate dehydrogenase complex dihydrolipoamide dehydrogenase (E3) component